MKIVTWNINGIKARIENVVKFLSEIKPDIIGLQEIKSLDDGFPTDVFNDLGYNINVYGQKSFNGVAIASLHPMYEIKRGLPNKKSDDQARFIEATFDGKKGPLRFASLYLPNGNPVGTEKFKYKLDWIERFHTYLKESLADEIPFVLAGDYNIIPEAQDAKNPKLWEADALYQPQCRQAFRGIINLGYTDALRACHPSDEIYTFWDYQAGAWNKNNGIRIDHILLSPQAADLLKSSGIDKHVRGWEKPSDHVPVWVELD
ncbi:MAG: exodeoxyribonuclease III [Hyphomicrobium sp.]